MAAPVGEVVRNGACVVIAGEPNTGKSSLFNAMLGRRRAIVTDVPGTTRDALEAVTEADGWPIRLIDTAGLRESSDPVEKLGVEVSREYIGGADVALACGDSADSLARAADAVAALTEAQVVRVSVRFRELDDATIARYVETGEPMDKAGAYGIQGYGATIVEHIEGDYFAVMGLSLITVVRLAQRMGVSYDFGPLHRG